MQNSKLIFIITACLAVSAVYGCGDRAEQRKYTEIFVDTKTPDPRSVMEGDPHAFMQMMPQDDIHANLQRGSQDMPMSDALLESVDNAPITWTTPKGWTEQKGSGLRMATLTPVNTSDPSEISFVSLGGSAGGLKGNVVRWMGQINIDAPGDSAMDDFLNRQEHLTTASGLDAVIIDLTQLQKEGADNAGSMIAAIIDRGRSQIFIKLTGTRKSVSVNRDVLIGIVNSVKTNE